MRPRRGCSGKLAATPSALVVQRPGTLTSQDGAMVGTALKCAFELSDRRAAHGAGASCLAFYTSRPRLAALLDDAVHDVLARKHLPGPHRQLHSTNPLKRPNEIERCTHGVAPFPNGAAIAASTPAWTRSSPLRRPGRPTNDPNSIGRTSS